MPVEFLVELVDSEAGHQLTPSHATKAGRRYRYYVSRPLVMETAKQHPGAWRIPATQLEHLIATEAAAMLAEPRAIAAVLENAGLEPEKVPAALAMADRFRDDLGSGADRRPSARRFRRAAARSENLNQANKLVRSYATLIEALDRHRGKGRQQHVTVKHVHIHRGGQAIVGTVHPGGGVPNEN